METYYLLNLGAPGRGGGHFLALPLPLSISSHWRCPVRKDDLTNFAKFTRKYLHQCCNAQACNFVKKETLAQVFSCEFCQICKNNFFYRIPLGDYFREQPRKGPPG